MRPFLLFPLLLTSVALANPACEIEVKVVKILKSRPAPKPDGTTKTVEFRPIAPKTSCKKMPKKVVKIDLNLYGDKVDQVKVGTRLLMDYTYWDSRQKRTVASGEKWVLVDILED